MARPNPSDALDRALTAALAGQAPPAGSEDTDFAGLVEIALALRGLPRADFRDALSAELSPPIVPHDLREAVKNLPPLHLRSLGTLDRATIGVFTFSGSAPWERHPDGDELIVVLDGGGEITLLPDGDGEPIRAALGPGRLFVCPNGLWHRPVATPTMTALYVTPLIGSEHSWAEDPRVG
ncbi:MAG TPA: cupin domain-containing protein [Candidatus Binatia bacterium]|nr:cupin domain-containing protein [Candidatus Binatia bacterium]